MKNIAILILAAGSSTRMGTPKQLLKWNKSNLLQHSIDNAKKSNSNHVVVVLGSNYELISTQIKKEGITILHHKHWNKGLGSSIAFGVKHIKKNLPETDGILIVLTDQPLIQSGYLKLLMNQFQLGKEKIVASLYDENKLGVPAIFDQVYFEELIKLNHDKGAKDILQKHINKISTVNAVHLTADLDTMEDYEKLSQSNFKSE